MRIRSALILALAMLLFAFALSYAKRAGFVEGETAERASQFFAGLVVVYFANLAPKTLEPLSQNCAAGRVQSLQRFSGWVLVIGGLGYSLAWLVAPIDYAKIAAVAILGSCVALVATRVGWVLATRGRGGPSAQA